LDEIRKKERGQSGQKHPWMQKKKQKQTNKTFLNSKVERGRDAQSSNPSSVGSNLTTAAGVMSKEGPAGLHYRRAKKMTGSKKNRAPRIKEN